MCSSDLAHRRARGPRRRRAGRAGRRPGSRPPRVSPERKTEPHIAPTTMRFRSTEKDSRIRGAVMEACSIPRVEELWEESVETETYEEYDGEQAVVIGSGEVRVLRGLGHNWEGRAQSLEGGGSTGACEGHFEQSVGHVVEDVAFVRRFAHRRAVGIALE